MKLASLLLLASMLGGCAVEAAPSAAAEEGVPTFAGIAYLTNSGSSHDVADNSCDCIETGKCRDLRVEPTSGHFEQRGEVCDWNSTRRVLNCTYDVRFVTKTPPLPVPKKGEKIELPPYSEWPETPGKWATRKISAKNIRSSDAAAKWCILPTAYNEG